MIGDGIGALLTTAFNMIKPALPKIASTIGLAGLSTGISQGINIALKKDTILKISDKQLNYINKNLEKINKMNVFDKKITLNQKGSGIFSFLLPMLASTIIPALIPKKEKMFITKIIFFEQIKNKYPELFKKSNYPLSNIFINNLLENEKSYLSTFSKDEIPLVENNKSLIFNLQNSNEKGSHWIALSGANNNIFISTVLELVISLKIFMTYIKILILLQIYIEFNM